jgi:hypothetical protein
MSRLTPKPIWSFNADGTVLDLGRPDQTFVCFIEIGNTLSKIARFNGRYPGPAYSDAQHCIMGAQAVLNEGGTNADAALFLLHDAHEWALGDTPRPATSLYDGVARDLYGDGHVADSIAASKAAWDEVIYAAARLPGPETWTKRQRSMVKAMDDRMCRAEAIALFGPRAAEQFPKITTPKTTGAIRSWGAMKAEEEFRKMAYRLIGEDRVLEQAGIAAAARALR